MVKTTELRVEHFKSLQEQYRQYLFQVQQLWLFKLTTLGAVVAAALFTDKIIQVDGINTREIVIAGLFALPLLAFLIDLKALEVGLQVKLISDHLKEHFGDTPEILIWEKNVWSGKKFASTRTILTIATAIGTSTLVLIISFIIINHLTSNWGTYLLLSSIALILIPIIVSIKMGTKIMR